MSETTPKPGHTRIEIDCPDGLLKIAQARSAERGIPVAELIPLTIENMVDALNQKSIEVQALTRMYAKLLEQKKGETVFIKLQKPLHRHDLNMVVPAGTVMPVEGGVIIAVQPDGNITLEWAGINSVVMETRGH